MELTGAGILMECLRREGVTTLFGYPGGAVIDIFDALNKSGLQHILVRHEQAAVHAADGYARATGKVGVALVTSGPGATNTVTGIATAANDSIPLVVLTGQVPTPLIGNDAFQEVDIVGITRPCTKHNYLVKDIRKLASTLRQAFYLARTGRPGPVLVDLPKDVMVASTDFVWPEVVKLRSYIPPSGPNLVQLRRASDLLQEARRPLLLVGGGVILSNASEPLRQLAEQCNIPVISTLMGLGGFPAKSPLWFGFVGMHGRFAANRAVSETDLLLAVGTRFADRVTGKISEFAKEAKIVHIDVDPTSIRKTVQVDVPIVADCREALQGLLTVLGASSGSKSLKAAHAPWVEHLTRLNTEKPLGYEETDEIKPQQAIETISRLTPADAIVATDVGQHQMWTAQFYAFQTPRTFLTSGGLGTMGYGLPAAIGAQVALPERQVVLVAGDGSIQMNIQELATAVHNKIPVKIFILNNRFLGMVRQWQQLFYNRNYSFTPMEGQPDFVKLAEAYGATGIRISDKKDLEPAIARALQADGTVVVDITVAREENVYPMVPAGAGLDQMLMV